MPEVNLIDFFSYFKGTPEQKEAVQMLQQSMPASLLTNKAAWVQQYRAKPAVTNPLNVEYFWQRDNYDGRGDRECQTSSIAMALKFLGVKGINTDDDYLRIVNRIGDTTEQATHMKALGELGVSSRFVTSLHKSDIVNQIEAGKPIPLGYLHHGSVGHPTGGHYLCAIGFTDTHLIAHDPFGDLGMVSGQWVATGPTDGKSIHYSWENFLKRWDVGGGWGWIL